MPPSNSPRRLPFWGALGIRQRLLLVLALPLVAVVMASTFLDYRLARKTADNAFDHALADAVYDLEAHIRKLGTAQHFDLAEAVEAMLRSNEQDAVYFSIRTGAGELLAGDADLPEIAAAAVGSQIGFFDALYHDQKVRGARLRVTLPAAEIVVTVLETVRRREHISRHILTAMTLQNLAVIAVTLLVVFLGIRQGLLPLRALEAEIAARTVEDLREIELSSVPAELRSLLNRLNELFELLRDASRVQQRFIGDAAHQLRTPLAGLQTQLDLAAGEGLFRDHPERLAHIEGATRRIEHLLSQLLAYAKAENSRAGVDATAPVALDQLVEKSASEFLDAAVAKGIDLGFDIAPATTPGYGWLLQEALANLIDNAIRYTPHDGVITVRCGSRDGCPFLEVEDSGPGISAEHLPHVTERFFRVPGAPGDGCGLGLAIVSEIALLHQAVLELHAGKSGGLVAGLRFH